VYEITPSYYSSFSDSHMGFSFLLSCAAACAAACGALSRRHNSFDTSSAASLRTFDTKPRIRREWRTLSPAERQKVADAFRVLKTTTTEDGRTLYNSELFWNLDDLTMLHACAVSDPRCGQGHAGPHFMTFHRATCCVSKMLYSRWIQVFLHFPTGITLATRNLVTVSRRIVTYPAMRSLEIFKSIQNRITPSRMAYLPIGP
jgi:hypothetical protein